jgi:hypothetical protein
MFILSAFILLSVSCSKRVDEVKLHPILKKFQPEEQLFRIDPRKENILTGDKGTRLVIPPGAFDLDYDDLGKNIKINIRLTEYITSFDLSTSGISMTYFNKENDEEELFESAGMFHIAADYKNEELKLLEKKKIKVQFPNIVPGEKFNVYKINKSGQWEYNGHNQESESTKMSSGIFYALREGRTSNTVYLSVRIYHIDELTYWNFDYPRKDSAWIKGEIGVEIEDKSKLNYQFFIIGISKKGYWTKWSQKKDFSACYYQNTDVKILIITSDGQIGISEKFNTGERYGHFKNPEGPHNYAKKIKPIKVKKIKKKLLKNRKAFLKYLKLKDKRKYKVKYR